MDDFKQRHILRFLISIKRVSLLFLFLCIFITINSTSANAEEGYIQILKTDDSAYSLYIPSVEDRGEYIVGWIKRTLIETQSIDGKVIDYVMTLCAAHKEMKQMQLLSQAIYDKEGNVIQVNSFQFNSNGWKDCIPNSNGEIFWMCITTANSVYNKSE